MCLLIFVVGGILVVGGGVVVAALWVLLAGQFRRVLWIN